MNIIDLGIILFAVVYTLWVLYLITKDEDPQRKASNIPRIDTHRGTYFLDEDVHSYTKISTVESHEYVYGGFHVMGDCAVCGHTEQSTIHIRPA